MHWCWNTDGKALLWYSSTQKNCRASNRAHKWSYLQVPTEPFWAGRYKFQCSDLLSSACYTSVLDKWGCTSSHSCKCTKLTVRGYFVFSLPLPFSQENPVQIAHPSLNTIALAIHPAKNKKKKKNHPCLKLTLYLREESLNQGISKE